VDVADPDVGVAAALVRLPHRTFVHRAGGLAAAEVDRQQKLPVPALSTPAPRLARVQHRAFAEHVAEGAPDNFPAAAAQLLDHAAAACRPLVLTR
jgi:hypothetical protein